MFPKRFITAVCPEYPELKFQLLANPTGQLYDTLIRGHTSDDEAARALAAALVEAFAGARVEGYNVTLDFSTVDGALAVLRNEDLPVDLRAWIRNAPIDVVTWQREQIEKNWGTSFGTGS